MLMAVCSSHNAKKPMHRIGQFHWF